MRRARLPLALEARRYRTVQTLSSLHTRQSGAVPAAVTGHRIDPEFLEGVAEVLDMHTRELARAEAAFLAKGILEERKSRWGLRRPWRLVVEAPAGQGRTLEARVWKRKAATEGRALTCRRYLARRSATVGGSPEEEAQMCGLMPQRAWLRGLEGGAVVAKERA